MQLTAGIFLGIVIALTAWRLGSLSVNGAVAAAITGAVVFGLGGLPWAVVLLTFFISSSALSRAFRRRKIQFDEKFSKGSQRDWGQVLANGGLGALLAIGYFFWPHPFLWYLYIGVIAAVNADTWATEIGVLSHQSPRLITTGKMVVSGTSGGITLLGVFASLAGGFLIGTAAAISQRINNWEIMIGTIIAASIAGLLGSLCDSLLGATIQTIYYCPACNKETERHPRHTCDTQTNYLRGWRWMDNDWVNFLASCAGGIFYIGLVAGLL